MVPDESVAPQLLQTFLHLQPVSQTVFVDAWLHDHTAYSVTLAFAVCSWDAFSGGHEFLADFRKVGGCHFVKTHCLISVDDMSLADFSKTAEVGNEREAREVICVIDQCFNRFGTEDGNGGIKLRLFTLVETLHALGKKVKLFNVPLISFQILQFLGFGDFGYHDNRILFRNAGNELRVNRKSERLLIDIDSDF